VAKTDYTDKINAEVMADLVADPQTTDHLRVKIITKLLESREGQSFFKTLFEEGLSFGECPCCGHETHWAIPEDELNQMGYVSYEKDPLVKEHHDIKTCPEFQEAHFKKKITI
jgi:hypothetical protein